MGDVATEIPPDNAEAPTVAETGMFVPATNAPPTEAFTAGPTLVDAPAGHRVDPVGADTGATLDAEASTAPFWDSGGNGAIGAENLPGVAGYLVLDELGRGGMGVVYRAHHIALDRPVALKMVLAGGHATADQLQRFRDEAQAVAKLSDPRIVQIHDVGTHRGLPYSSLEYVGGDGLAQRIGGKPQTPRAAAEAVETLAAAMMVAHRAQIIHRDLKPANILRTRDGALKITDFGLAKRLEGDSKQTRDGSIMGTHSYITPEQARGDTTQIGPAADQYALGSILYEMLTGRPPFQGASPLDTLDQVRTQEPVPPTRLQPKIPADLERICLKCLQKGVDKRYADCQSLADDLHRYLRGEPILARPVSTAERTVRWCRRNPWLAGLTAAVMLLMVAATSISAVAAISLNTANDKLVVQRDAAKAAKTRAETGEKEAKAARFDADVQSARATKSEAVMRTALGKEAEVRKKETAARKLESEARKQTTVAIKQETEARKLETAAKELAQQREDKVRLAFKATKEQNTEALIARRYLSVLTYERLRSLPNTHAIRQELLRTAAEALDRHMVSMIKRNEVERDTGDKKLADRTMCGIYQRDGKTFEEVGRLDVAKAKYRKMEEYAARMLAENPADVECLKVKAAVQNTIAELYFKWLGDADEARRRYAEGLSLRTRWAELAPGEATPRWVVSNSYGALANVEARVGDLPRAWEMYGKEVEWRDRVPSPASESIEFRRERAHMDLRMGALALRLGRVADARACLDRAGSSFRSMVGQVPEIRHDLDLLAFAQAEVDLLFRGDPAAARDDYTSTIAELTDRVAADPENIMARKDLALAHYYLGTALLRPGDKEGSRVHDARCLELREALSKVPAARMEEVDMLIALARVGRVAEAAKIADELIAVPPQDARIDFFAACGYALCAGAVDDDEKAARRYTDLALAALSKGIDVGWRDKVSLQTDPDLDPIKADPGFAAALARIAPPARP